MLKSKKKNPHNCQHLFELSETKKTFEIQKCIYCGQTRVYKYPK